VHKILVGKITERDRYEDIFCREQDNIRKDLEEIGSEVVKGMHPRLTIGTSWGLL
jgi:hypothetical protein